MRQARTLVVKFEGWEDFKGRVRAALRKGRPSLARKDTLVFNSVADYQKFMTEQKLAILVAILNKKPSSIYKLAQFVDRDFANVQRDCTALEAMGFVRLDESGDAKGSKAPRLAFDYTRILILMPKLRYAHDLAEAA